MWINFCTYIHKSLFRVLLGAAEQQNKIHTATSAHNNAISFASCVFILTSHISTRCFSCQCICVLLVFLRYTHSNNNIIYSFFLLQAPIFIIVDLHWNGCVYFLINIIHYKWNFALTIILNNATSTLNTHNFVV